jgi:hypothetical protein
LLVCEQGGELRNSVLQKEWDRFLAGDSNLAPGLWAVVMFRAWQDRWLTRSASVPNGFEPREKNRPLR